MLAKGKLEFYRFEGTENFDVALQAVAVVDKSSTYRNEKPGVVEIHSTAHSFKVGDRRDIPNHIFIKGTDNYDGLHVIFAEAPVDANSLYLIAKYVAETTATADYMYPGLQFDEPWEFVGFKFHGDADGATTENLVIQLDSDAGSLFDTVLYTRDMNGVTDIVYMFDVPVPIRQNDVVKCTWANTGSVNWGLELIAQRLS